MSKKPRLHNVNSIRVIAEYFVIRYHVLKQENGEHGAVGLDIMSFFFVLSGFGTMYTFEPEYLTTARERVSFMWGRVWRVYPIFLFNWLCWLPFVIGQMQSPKDGCMVYQICPWLQLVMLDSWSGCGYLFGANGLSWYLSCVLWMWMAFPFLKDRLVTFFDNGDTCWGRIAMINLFFSSVPVLLWGFDIYTLCPFPPIRIGEFIMGCGVSHALTSNHPIPVMLSPRFFWIPFAFGIGMYTLENVNHGMDAICLHENAQHSECAPWHWGQTWLENRPPCITVFEKIFNKYALIWAGLILVVAKEEDGLVTRVLHCDLFQILNRFSLTLYLSHQNIWMLIQFVSVKIIGWQSIHDDTMLFLVYIICYLLDSVMKTVVKMATPVAEPEVEKLMCIQES